MNPLRVWLPVSALLGAVAGTASGQVISIKTVPIAQADQYVLFPSYNLGMGGVSIALPDTLLDLSVNPATGARLTGARFFGSPVIYSVSQNAGGGGAVPIGAIARSGSWFGAFSLALQVVDPGRSFPPSIFFQPNGLARSTAPPLARNQSEGNASAFAMLGKVWPATGISLGGSASWTRLNAVDGVDMLYGTSQHVRQFGHSADYRLGFLKEWAGGQTLEAIALRTRFRMTHDVTFLDFFWDPGSQTINGRPRLEQNLDHTDTWGLHLAYQRPLRELGWRIGWMVTGNRMFHSEIPNFEVVDAGIKNVPWDPGNSYAYNFGVGVSRTSGPVRVGIDAIYEPIWSHTWGEAEIPIPTRLGDTIPVGGMTVENKFQFSNALFRMGVGRELPLRAPGNAIGLQLGLMVRANHYWLAQYDHVQAAGRNHEERWMEWTPTWGWSLRFPEFEIRYHGRVTNGTQRPGAVPGGGCGDCFRTLEAPANLLPTPISPLNMGSVSVVTHQISISLPLGRPATPGGAR